MEGLIFGIFTVLSNLPYLIIIVSSMYSLTITGYSILVLKCGLLSELTRWLPQRDPKTDVFKTVNSQSRLGCSKLG